MVMTGNMSKSERNESLDEELKETLNLVGTTYATLESKRVSRTEPLGPDWIDYDHEELAKLIKYYFKDNIDGKSNSSKKTGYEELLSSIGERLAIKILIGRM